jgi:cell division protease FtsH
VEEAKEELLEVVEFLKEPEKFVQLGARIPKGVLLVGAPGTGKTLLAKAVSGEAGVPFFSISGSEFVEMFVGVGASRVRDLFEQAKRHSPCIVFLDEVDAVGRHRGAGLGGSHDEREQTLNQILVEMDGFDTDTNVIIMAATNRPDILDPALLRPGRFDRRVVLDRPDIRGREAILKVHVRGKPLSEDVDLRALAKSTPGFVGADIENLVNEAAILAARRDKKVIEMDDFEESVDRVIAGPERKSRLISDEEKRITAYHEAGHGVVAHVLPKCDPVHKISIVARGLISGYTVALPEDDRRLLGKAKFRDDLAYMLGGRAAEELVFEDVTTGAANDLERVTELARAMVTRYGMSNKLGPMTFGRKEELIFLGKEIGEQRNYSDAVAQEIDEEVRRIIGEAHERATDALVRHREQLDRIAQRLIEVETLDGDEFVALFEGVLEEEPETPESPPPVPGVKRPVTQSVPERREPTLDMPPAPAPA